MDEEAIKVINSCQTRYNFPLYPMILYKFSGRILFFISSNKKLLKEGPLTSLKIALIAF